MLYRVVLMSTTAAWPLSAIAAQQINALRKRAGLNRDQLAEKCRDLGAPDNMTAAAVANIETGRPDPATGRRRRDITVDELVIFALALNVPPVVLLFPVGHVEQVEVLPKAVRPTMLAANWFMAEQPWCDTSNADGKWFADFDRLDDWRRNRAGIDYYRQVSQIVRDWDAADKEAERQRERMDAATDDAARETARRAAESADGLAAQHVAALRQAQRSARGQGFVPAALPEELAYVDSEEAPG